MRVLSGIQPSGSLHLGNYFGMMSKMIAYQEESELFCFIANYHAQTSLSDGKVLARGTIEAAANFLALGMDPEKSTFWVQSDVPEVQELTWVLSNFTPMGLLERCHSYKDKIGKGIAANHGLFAYPVLMTADILLFQSEKVPVGKDQKSTSRLHGISPSSSTTSTATFSPCRNRKLMTMSPQFPDSTDRR